MPYVPWTTPKEMRDVMSSLGVDLRTEDAADPDALALQYAKIGTNRVLLYLSRVASPEALADNDWVRECATLAACYHLSGHGGEPVNETFKALWEEMQADLELIRSKQADVPGYAPAAPNDFAPNVVNPIVDMQAVRPLRHVRGNSTMLGTYDLPGALFPVGGRRWY